jgi:DNA helicase-2/ATP-dependent DNA helicase PcrA
MPAGARSSASRSRFAAGPRAHSAKIRPARHQIGEGLNAAQREAVCTLRGPLLVLAAAGTGKTRVITHRIAALIDDGVRPERILAVTFTNKAALEMKERAAALLGRRAPGGSSPEISTFHSLCVRMLRRHAARIGRPPKFAIYDRGDQESAARAALREVRVSHEKLRPGELIALISGWKSRGLRAAEAEQAAEGDRQLLAALAYARYEAALRAAGALDFDDLLLCGEELLRDPQARRAEQRRFDHLLIDEYQDTNRPQYEIARALAQRHRNLCVVGDDEQSIYGWRGDWPDAKVVRLEENYRSRAPILELANVLIAHNSNRHPKRLVPVRPGGLPVRFLRFEDETAEAAAIARDIRAKLDAPEGERAALGDFAILFRTNLQPRPFEIELRREKIPYHLVGSSSFWERKEVRDVMAYLKLLAHPEDEVSLLRVLNVPPRGIGSGTAAVLLEEAVRRGCPLWHALPQAVRDGRVPHAAEQRIKAFVAQVDAWRTQLGRRPLAELGAALLSEIGYRAELGRRHPDGDDAEARWASVEEVLNALAGYERRAASPTLAGFLEESALASRDEQQKDDARPPGVTLMTLHAAKGLEFPHVVLVGMEEGLLPHQRTLREGSLGLEEERRLCYVGVTRARETLTLSLAKGRTKWGKLRPSIPSRFLYEMRGETEKARRAADAAMKALAGADGGTLQEDGRTNGDHRAPARSAAPCA